MKSNQYTFLILVISWLCFTIGCGVSAAYLKVSSQYEEQSRNIQTIEAMQIQEQNVSTAADAADENASAKHFMEVYFGALQSGDYEQLTSMVEDPDTFFSRQDLLKMTSYVEAYQNLKYYLTGQDQDNAVIVFVFYEIKLYDIDTVVPGVSQYYMEKKGKTWVIYNNEEHLNEDASKEMKASLRLRKIKTLIEQTKKDYKKAMETDPSLKEYLEEEQ
jgi:hypothetical protein